MNKLLKFLKSVFFHKRMKSFYWRAGGMLSVELLAVVPATLADFQVPQAYIIVVGLVLGEITKYLNTKK
jgi:hypothetical protein